MNDTTLIIPAKYEPNSLPLVLDEIKNKRLKLKIIIILDKDDSDTLNAIKNYDCEIIYQSKKGYGNAIIDGLKNSKTKYSCIFYADGSTDPKFLESMKNKLETKNLDFVFGSRYEGDGYSLDDDFITTIGNHSFTFLGNLFLRLNISDILYTYVFGKTDKFAEMDLSRDDYSLCIEIPLKTKKFKFKYDTVPCVERKRFNDKKKVSAFSDGFKILKYFIYEYFKILLKKFKILR